MAERDLMDVVDDLLDRNTNGIGSVSDLARHMHEIEPRQNFESWRKNLRKWRKSNASESNIAIIARAFGIERERLPAAKKTPTVSEVDRRLAAVEAAVGLVEEGSTVGNLLEELATKLADVTERVRELEAQSGHGGASSMGSP